MKNSADRPKPMMDRAAVYRVIDAERAYQTRTHKGRALTMPEYMLKIKYYVDESLDHFALSSNNRHAQTCIAKIAALSVACMEQYGCRQRGPGV